MLQFDRKRMEALYEVFKGGALDDQRLYYQRIVARNRKAAAQVNQLRALFALLTGLASALAGLIVAYAVAGGTLNQCVAAPEPSCTAVNTVVPLLLVVAVVAPALGAAFTTLADLYQWDRLTAVYDVALENLEVADAQSPVPGMDDDIIYRAALRAYAEGTLSVMRDETAQWGQLIMTPESLEHFVAQERIKAEAASASAAERAESKPPPAAGGDNTAPPG